MVFASRNIKADEAYRVGLVNAVYTQGRADAGCEEAGRRYRKDGSDRCQKQQEGDERRTRLIWIRLS